MITMRIPDFNLYFRSSVSIRDTSESTTDTAARDRAGRPEAERVKKAASESYTCTEVRRS